MSLSPDQNATFIRLLREHETQIIVYVRALMPSLSEAEDVIQETRIRLWEQFDQFEPGSNFGAWACTIARYFVMTHYTKQGRDRLRFSSEAMERIAQEVDRASQGADARIEALPKCIAELSDSNRQLLAMCYSGNHQIQEVAKLLDRTVNATYLALSRLRRSLRSCVERRIA